MEAYEARYGTEVTFIGTSPRTLIGKVGTVVGHTRWMYGPNGWRVKIRVRFPGYQRYRVVEASDLSIQPPHRVW